MDIKDNVGCNQKAVTFDNQKVLDITTDKLTAMMTTLTTQNNKKAKPFKPKVYPKRGGQGRNNYYDKRRDQSRKR